MQGLQSGDVLTISVWDGENKIASQNAEPGASVNIDVPNAKAWSPSNPFLYDLKYTITRKGKVVDEVTSYFGMRKISVGTDKKGIRRMLLNNEFVFQFGPLDQGWWPDGLYTAPSDEALKFDIEKQRKWAST